MTIVIKKFRKEVLHKGFGTPAAVAGAIYHATGKRQPNLPFRLDDLLA